MKAYLTIEFTKEISKKLNDYFTPLGILPEDYTYPISIIVDNEIDKKPLMFMFTVELKSYSSTMLRKQEVYEKHCEELVEIIHHIYNTTGLALSISKATHHELYRFWSKNQYQNQLSFNKETVKEKLSCQQVIDKWFKNEKSISYTGSDKLQQLSTNHMISYEKSGGIVIYKSSSEGEDILGVFQDGEDLDTLLTILIHKA